MSKRSLVVTAGIFVIVLAVLWFGSRALWDALVAMHQRL
jgi:hypothetical protein